MPRAAKMPAPPPARRAVLCAALALALAATQAQGADPQPYTVAIDKTGDDALDKAMADSSMLISLAKTAPVGPFALLARAREDRQRFAAALDSLGFYKATLVLKIGGRALDDPGLDDWLDRAPAEPPVAVTVKAEPGPLFRLRRVEVQGEVSAAARAKLGLKPGDPARAAEVLAGRGRLLEALRGEGHALAKVGEPDAVLAPEAEALDVAYAVDAGPAVEIGQVSLNGLQDVDEAYLRRRLLLAYGQPYSPEAVEQARQDLSATGVFASVRARLADAVDGQGRLPVAFDLAERPKRSTGLGAAWSTDLGGSLSANWQHRNLFGGAEQLNLAGAVTQIGGNSTTGIGYKGSVGFVKPDFFQRDQSLQVSLAAIKQSLTAYDEKAYTFGVSLRRKFAGHWEASLGLEGEQSQITQQGVTYDYTLLSLPATVKYDSSDSLLDPTRGVRASASLIPVQPLAGPKTTVFAIAQLAGSAYFDLAEPGRTVLAVRGTVGDVEGGSQFELPPNKRFYAGGSATVRGYKYQSIGPRFPDGNPQGGTSMSAGTVELRQRILDSYGAVAFADVGQVNADGPPFVGVWRLGVGVGARYYTGFGPIRLDVALPVNKDSGSGSFEVYIGLGQAF
jgi:translocation and assembly module TamA